mmetsp:Transcript_4155/g.5329  ORF Transcript_4155/g.5329 Transcript_4155/m.5329 type:complete len:186 (-) Transcript_4155:8-565(-)
MATMRNSPVVRAMKRRSGLFASRVSIRSAALMIDSLVSFSRDRGEQMSMPGLRMIRSCAPFLPNLWTSCANVPLILVGELSWGLKTFEFFFRGFDRHLLVRVALLEGLPEDAHLILVADCPLGRQCKASLAQHDLGNIGAAQLGSGTPTLAAPRASHSHAQALSPAERAKQRGGDGSPPRRHREH